MSGSLRRGDCSAGLGLATLAMGTLTSIDELLAVYSGIGDDNWGFGNRNSPGQPVYFPLNMAAKKLPMRLKNPLPFFSFSAAGGALTSFFRTGSNTAGACSGFKSATAAGSGGGETALALKTSGASTCTCTSWGFDMGRDASEACSVGTGVGSAGTAAGMVMGRDAPETGSAAAGGGVLGAGVAA